MDVRSEGMAVLDGWVADRRGRPVERLALSDLGRIECRLAEAPDDLTRWQTLLDREHFLGSGPLVGARLRYLVRSEHLGDVAALAFSAPAWRLASRDAYIGWDDETRRRHLERVVCNSRFLIRPHLRVPGLASRVLSQALRRLPGDWAAHHGETPALVETFIDRTRHRGGCYRAANWIYVGDTAGRGRNDTGHRRGQSVKAVYLYPLERRWRKALGVERTPEYQPDVDDWARHEFAHLRLGDRRLNERVITVSRAFASQSTASLPQACGGSRAANQAACRLFANPRVSMDAILRSHYQATLGRCRGRETVLVPQDTTTLNYSAHPLTEGLGPIGAKAEGAQGLIVHDTLAVTPQGTPLGLIDVQCWARDAETHGKRRLGVDEQDFDNKESGKWLDSHLRASQLQRDLDGTRVVSVCDREGDIYELLLAAQPPDAADVLVRVQHSRSLTGGAGRLIEHLDGLDAAGVRELAVPRRGNQKARTARMAVRFARVTLEPPASKRKLPALTIDVVRTTEIGAPEGIKPLSWTLLTTVPTETLEQACERIDWYARRWEIELYHRTLKSGCRIEDRQFGQADRIEACLGVDLVVAWRVMLLAKQGREDPDAPCSVYFSEDEWKALLVRTGAPEIPEDDDEPTLREAMRRVAALGGFLGRKGDGEPGTQTLWRGLQRLDDITVMYQELTKMLLGGQRRGAP